MATCAGITRAGTACKGIPFDGSQWCYAHDPDRTDERRRHGSKGGKRAGRGRPQYDLADIKARLSGLADDVLAGEVDKGVAAVATQVLNVYLRALTVELKVREQQEITERLEELETLLEQRREARHHGA